MISPDSVKAIVGAKVTLWRRILWRKTVVSLLYNSVKPKLLHLHSRESIETAIET